MRTLPSLDSPRIHGFDLERIDLNEVVLALSDALDLVGTQVVQHGKRVAFMAAACGRSLSLEEEERTDLLLAAVLHDCGVSTTRLHRKLLDADLSFEEAHGHADAGGDLLAQFEPLSRVAAIVRLHHTPWDSPASREAGPRTALLANLVFLADRVDALLQATGSATRFSRRTRSADGSLPGRGRASPKKPWAPSSRPRRRRRSGSRSSRTTSSAR